jgi:hypothetical protein
MGTKKLILEGHSTKMDQSFFFFLKKGTLNGSHYLISPYLVSSPFLCHINFFFQINKYII